METNSHVLSTEGRALWRSGVMFECGEAEGLSQNGPLQDSKI